MVTPTGYQHGGIAAQKKHQVTRAPCLHMIQDRPSRALPRRRSNLRNRRSRSSGYRSDGVNQYRSGDDRRRRSRHGSDYDLDDDFDGEEDEEEEEEDDEEVFGRGGRRGRRGRSERRSTMSASGSRGGGGEEVDDSMRSNSKNTAVAGPR